MFFFLDWSTSNLLSFTELIRRSITMKCHYGHFVLSKSTSFIRANMSSLAHCFSRSLISYQVVKILHFSTRERKSNSNSERKTLWDSYDNNSDGNNKTIHKFWPKSILHGKSKIHWNTCLLRNTCSNVLTSTRDNFHHFKSNSYQHCYENHDSTSKTEFTNLICHSLKLLLQMSWYRILCLTLWFNNSWDSVISYSNNNSWSRSFNNQRFSEHVASITIFRIFFSKCNFWLLVRLSC